MKKLIVLIIAVIALSACSLGGSDSRAQNEQSASMTRVAGAVAATQTAMAEDAQPTPELTSPPSKLTLEQSMISGEALNVLLGIWPLEPEQSNIPSSNPLCLIACYQELWVSTDGRATLQVDLIEFPNRDQVVIELRDVKASQAVLGVREVEIPDYAEMPTDSWMQDNGSTGSRYTLHTRRGRVLVIMTIYLPDYDQDQNLLFLSLYGNEQLEMLDASGW